VTVQTSLELEFAGGDYSFDLRLPQMQELEEKCGRGIFAVYADILQGRYVYEGVTIGATNEAVARIADIRQVIRLGLIGGGSGFVDGERVVVDANMARRLVERHVDGAPLRDSWAVAAAVLGARIEGYTPPGEAGAGESPAPSTSEPTGDSSSPTAPSSEPIGEV